MKDSYSFDLDEAGLDRAFQRHFEAYRRIFLRCGLDTLAVEASVGAMGGSASIEFMVPSAAGEDRIACCGSCGYAANVEKATSALPAVEDGRRPRRARARSRRPGVRTIEDLARFAGGAPAERQIKTLVVRARRRSSRSCCCAATTRSPSRSCSTAAARASCGPRARRRSAPRSAPARAASARSACASSTVFADPALDGRRDMVTGANQDDVAPARRRRRARHRASRAGSTCARCAPASPARCATRRCEIEMAIEVGHIFKLGTRYSEALGAMVLDEAGASRPIVMGSYGIGIERAMAAVVERCHDADGIVWPLAVAPFEVVVTRGEPEAAGGRRRGRRDLRRAARPGHRRAARRPRRAARA